MRWLAIIVLLVACKKATQEEDPPPGPPKVGHSVTKVNGEETHTAGSAEAAGSATPDAHLMGGDSSPAYRGGDGRVHGPGGPVFMGRGVECNGEHNHCLRAGVWFSVGDIVAGKLFRAVPVFQFENKWWDWRGEEVNPTKLYRTELAGNTPIPAGTSIIWFASDDMSAKWENTEYAALTSSKWEAGVTEKPSANGSVKVGGWGPTTLDTVRLIVETK